ncbi:hypothetical protein OE88DRAFT_1651634 [Heliocybe sulcata]|uniref:Uncharacterized protein n=1 Tax=Heliocybe sulcata TaxID=5364 RepID=A0A5C3NEG4_9AGAM|nr:hypothetical protein OE88DRAFT_1651634 [Heliocybe sulcata]
MIVDANKTPTSPPPPYTPELPTTSSSAPSQPQPQPHSQPPAHSHPAFGPTPLAQQQGTLLPYYDPRSMHSVQQAGVRARKRFIGAILWAFVVMFVAGMVTGAGVGTRMR